jgi:hypothetical protein
MQVLKSHDFFFLTSIVDSGSSVQILNEFYIKQLKTTSLLDNIPGRPSELPKAGLKVC